LNSTPAFGVAILPINDSLGQIGGVGKPDTPSACAKLLFDLIDARDPELSSIRAFSFAA